MAQSDNEDEIYWVVMYEFEKLMYEYRKPITENLFGEYNANHHPRYAK